MCFVEWEECSLWELFYVECGFDRDDLVIMIFVMISGLILIVD